ncbi:MAG: pro-sigmaK processing inhibitor BofA family protein [Clostridia bacterium]|nr:pro-sigmaK processing inhibitor BofA family protein [Clostridia bacterium]
MLFFVYFALAAAALAVLIAFARTGRFIRCVLSSAVQGLVSLLAVNVLGTLTGVTVAVNPYTLGAVGLLGMPGTISLVLLNTVFHLQ